MQNAEGGFVPRQPKLPLKLHRRHARRLAGDQIGGPKPRAQRRVAALHDRADGQSRLAAASATGQDAGPRGDAERFTHDAAARAGEPVAPASPFQVGGAGRIVGEKSLKLGEGLRQGQVGAVENVHDLLSVLRTQSIPSGCMRQADRHDLIDALPAEPRHGIVPETRPPLFLALAGVFPAFAVDADDGFDRLGEGRHVGISSEGERIAARPCGFPVLEGRLPRFRQRDVSETAESCVTPDAIDGAAPYPLFGDRLPFARLVDRRAWILLPAYP